MTPQQGVVSPQKPQQQPDDPYAALTSPKPAKALAVAAAPAEADPYADLTTAPPPLVKTGSVDLRPPTPPAPLRMPPVVVTAARPMEVPPMPGRPLVHPVDENDRTLPVPPGVAPGDAARAYEKHGHPVVDTEQKDAGGHVPTHRLDQPTGRRPGETFADYEQRVLARTTWSPDTAARSDLSSLEKPVADSAKALLAQAKAEGIPIGPAETKRTQERQEMLFQKGRDGKGGGTVTWTLTSDHTPGNALDFSGPPEALEWLQTNAPKHGFSVMGAMDPGHVAIPAAATSTAAAAPAGPVRMPPVVVSKPDIPKTYQDSLTAITGTPRLGIHSYSSPVMRAMGLGRERWGQYNGFGGVVDHVALNKDQPADERDWTLAHELGHRLDYEGDPNARAAFDSAVGRPDAGKPQGYAATNTKEHFAEAFANATDALRFLDKPGVTRADVMKTLSSGEQQIPGTMALIKYLLDQPLYSDHPIQKYRRGSDGTPASAQPLPAPTMAARDATRATGDLAEKNPHAKPLTGVAKTLNDAFYSMADNPVSTATAIPLAPIKSAFTAGRYIGQKAFSTDPSADADASRSLGIEPITDRQAAFAAAQLAAVAGGGLLNAGVTKAVGAIPGAMRMAPVVGAGVEGAAVGGAYDEEDPTRGALLGSVLGMGINVVPRLKLRRPGAPEPIPTERQLTSGDTKRKVEVRVLDEPNPAAPHEPDYTVEDPYTELVQPKQPAQKPRPPKPEPVKGFKLPGDEHGVPAAPKLEEVETSLASLKQEHAAASDELTRGELTSRINMLEAQRRKLKGEPEPEMAGAADVRRAQAAGVRNVKDIPQGAGPPGARVAKAALRVGDVVHTGASHVDIIGRLMDAHGNLPAGVAEGTEGFTDEHERFLTREQARALANRAGQVAPSMAGVGDESSLGVENLKRGEMSRTPAPTKHEFSSTQLDLPPVASKGITALAAKIPDADLAKDGRETEPHITVKYGLHGNEPEKVRALLADEKPITVTLGKTSLFPDSGSGDVVKVDVDSPALHALNKKISDALPHTDTHPDYAPHATVAYVKPGLGKKYEGDASLAGQQITLHSLTFSGKDGKKVEIPLGGAPAAGKPAYHKKTSKGTVAGTIKPDIHGLLHSASESLETEGEAAPPRDEDVAAADAARRLKKPGRAPAASIGDDLATVQRVSEVPDGAQWMGKGVPGESSSTTWTRENDMVVQRDQYGDETGNDHHIDSPEAQAAFDARTSKKSVAPAKQLKKPKGFQMNNAPPGGWTEADKVPTAAERARKAGAAAFARGDKRIPAQDHATIPLIKGAGPKGANEILAAWLKGWDQANLAPESRESAPAAVDTSAASVKASNGAKEASDGTVRGPVSEGARGATSEGVRADEPGAAPAGRAGGGTASERPARRPDEASGAAAPRAEGLSEPGAAPSGAVEPGGRVGDRGSGPASRVERAPRRQPGAGNYRLTPSAAQELIAATGAVAKAKRNLAAIELLKQIEAEGRPATLAEQEALSKYVGWGGMPHLFDPAHANFGALGKQLQEFLTADEWDAARASTPNAHYTSPEVIEATHALLNRMGFVGGRILEPSMGAGYFLGLTPEAHRSAYHWTGVELDAITGRIGKLLYPESDIRVQGFQDLQVPDGYFDAAVGNVPFGDYKVHDPRYNKHKLNIHNYFFRKTLDTVRPGGVVAFITSRYTMDAQDPTVRQELAKHADLLGAIRLPSDAFKGIANTEVVTDLIVLRKRAPGAAPSPMAWERSVAHPVGDGETRLNEYFTAHPEHILGQLALEGTMYGADQQTVKGSGPLAPKLRAAIAHFEPGQYKALEPDSPGTRETRDMPVVFATDEVKDYGLTVHQGKIMQRRAGVLVDAKVPAAAVDRVTKLIALRDLAKDALRSQVEDQPEPAIEAARTALNKAYDKFVRQHGPILKEVRLETKRLNPAGEPIVQLRYPNLQHFDDAERALVTALEYYDSDTGTADKSDLLTRRVFAPRKAIERVDTPAEALPVTLAEVGHVDLPRIAQLAGTSIDDARQALRGQVYEDPASPGVFRTLDEYTSGDVKAKLAVAATAAKKDPARYAENVKALETAIPADLPPSKISANLGAPWIPPKDVEAFIRETLGDGTVKVEYTAAAGVRWKVEADWRVQNTVASTNEYGTKRMNAATLVEDALNLKSPTVYDRVGETSVKNVDETLAAQEKQQKIKDRFERWAWERPERADRLARLYNDKFNRIRLSNPDGSHLTLPGTASYIKGKPFHLRPHQRNAIWRILTQGNTLLAHVVGSGKTYTMIAGGMESKRLGLARKPAYIVPNHMLDQFSTEFKQLYPAANLLLATKDDFAREERQAFVARAATNNWDGVLMTHRSFESIGMSPEFQERYIKEQVSELESAIRAAKAAGTSRSTLKQIEKAKFNLEAKLEGLMAEGKKDNLLSFEQMGVDMLFVDEADEFKNLQFSTRMEGVSAPNAQRSFDLLMKSIHLEKVNPGRGLVFASGTPIANTVAEMYTMLRYLMPKQLAQRGIGAFDDWAATFGKTVVGMELRPDNKGFRAKARFAKYQNVGELAQLFRSVADVQTAEMLNLPRPKLKGGRMQTVSAPTSAPLKAYIKDLARRGEAVQQRKVDPDEDNWLKITGDGRAAALDMRLVDASALDLPDSKLNHAVNKIYETWRDTKALKGAQLVFSDLSTPGSDSSGRGGLPGFNVYDDIKRKLVSLGIPAKEVRFIHDAKTDDAKKKLFADVRAGRVRVLMGSTAKMGAGTNVQDRLVALHNLDAPWRPRDIEQRHGRILRQGNTLYDTGKIPHVEVNTYITEGSFDGYIWQGLERKAGFIQQALTADATTREIEDVDAIEIDWATAKAIASGNPKVKEKAEVDAQVARLERLERSHRDEQFDSRREIQSLPARIEGLERELVKVRADADRVEDTSGDHFTIRIGGSEIAKRADAYGPLQAAVQKAEQEGATLEKGAQKETRLGTFAGFDLYTVVSRSHMTDARDIYLMLRGAGDHFREVAANNSPASLLMQLEAEPKTIAGHASVLEDKLTSTRTRFETLQAKGTGAFPQAAELETLKKRQVALDAELAADAATADAEDRLPPSPSGGHATAMGFADPFTAAAHMLYHTKPVQATIGVAAAKLAELGRSLQETFDSASVTPNAGKASRIIRPHRAVKDREIARAIEALKQTRAAMDKLDPGPLFDGPRWQAYRAMEEGTVPTDPAMRSLWRTLRALQDSARDAVHALGPGHLDNFIADYMARVYVPLTGAKKSLALRRYSGRRPMEGPKGFKKARHHVGLEDSLAAALAKGVGPPTDNPIDMVLLKVEEMRRYVMAHRIKDELKGMGLAKFVKATRLTPDGYADLADRMFTVRAPLGAEGELRIRGRYAAPIDVARVVNNFLSPGLRGKVWYDAYAGLGNTMNMVQLGMSAFHLGLVAFDATAQLAAVGMDQVLTGKGPGGRLSGAGKILGAAVSAATGPITVIPLGPLIAQYLRGRKVWHAYFNDAQTKRMEATIDGLLQGGGLGKMDSRYKNGHIDKMLAAFHDRRWVGTILQAPLAALEASMWPLLEHVVPRMKLGAIDQMIEVEMAKLPAGASEDEHRKVAARVVDAIDARLGQMIYSNRFWHTATKEILMAGIRSVGWNVGSLDVTVGAGAQLLGNARQFGKGERPESWHKVQYLAAVAGMVALYGAMYTYLHTGEAPKDWKDYYYPRTGSKDRDGNPERISPATYMKDVFAMVRHPIQTIEHKTHPLLNAIAEILSNKNFYGDEIVNRDDPAMKQLHEVAHFVVGDVFKPFTFRNVEEMKKRGAGTREKIEGFLGNQAAPREVVRTPAQNKMAEYLARRGHPTRTPDERDASDERQDIRQGLREGTVTRDSVRKLVRAGEFSYRQAGKAVTDARQDPRLVRFKMLSPEEADVVYDLGTPEEQALWSRVHRVKERKLNRLRLRRPATSP